VLDKLCRTNKSGKKEDRTVTLRINQIALICMTLGCSQEPEKVVEEFEEVSDIPQPSRDLEDDDDNDDPGNSDDDQDDSDDSDDDQQDVSETTEYRFESETSLIYVQVFKDTSALGSAFAHDHVMRADNFEGIVVYNPDDLSACEISFSVPVADLRVDETGMRELVGYGDELTVGDRETIREHMLANDQLKISSFSTIAFDSTTCSGDSGTGGTLTVQGGLTVRGRTADVSLPVRFEIDDGQFYAQASFDMNHSQFGMEPYSAYGGAVRNDDPLRFTLDIVGQPN